MNLYLLIAFWVICMIAAVGLGIIIGTLIAHRFYNKRMELGYDEHEDGSA